MTSVLDSPDVDWHTHSDLTDGADSPAAMADAAARADLAGWGLSDHVRADSTWVDGYVTTVRALRRGDLQIFCGVEAKLLDRAGHLDIPPRLPHLDHLLVADHQFPGDDGPVSPATVRSWLDAGRLSVADVVDTVVDATCAGLGRSPAPAIVAHLFSLLPKLGLDERDVTDEHRSALAAACVATDSAVEVNEKWVCPSAETVRRLREAGVRIVRGSDAHRAGDVGRHAHWDDVVATWAPAASGAGAGP